MASTRGIMHLNLFVSTFGSHQAAWQRAEASVSSATDPRHFVRIAQIAERGLLDALFVADIQAPPMGIGEGSSHEFEPATLLSFLAAQTTRIGLIATLSTTFTPPFALARQISSLDLLSGGRAGVNLVTSAADGEARVYGMEAIPDPLDRYARANEVADVLIALWDSYPLDTLLGDKQNGVYFDLSRLRPVRHHGDRLSVEGTLDVPPSPQGRPVIVQAGASDEGRALAARVAEVVFASASTAVDARAYREDVMRRAVAFGRRPDDVAVLPAMTALVADNAAEARDYQRYLDSLTPLQARLNRLGNPIGSVFTEADLDELMPELPPAHEAAIRPNHVGGYERSRYLSKDETGRRRTVGEAVRFISASRSGLTVAGTASHVADEMCAWFGSGACDGFNLTPPTLPESLESFVDKVIPELQDRGVFRTAYTGATLRDHLRQHR